MEYLKIVTYNLCWEGLEAEKKKPFGKGKIDMSHCIVNNKNICISNIANILTNSSNYDFILLQEIVENQWSKLLIAIKDFMPNFEEHYKWILTNQNGDKKAGIMVIYNKKYSIKYQMEGELETAEISISNKIGGRPYQIIIFNENLVVLNVHFPHKEDIKPYINFEKTLSTKLNTELRNIIELKNPKYQIIMGGDFNMDPRHFIQRILSGLNRKFYLPNIKINSL